MGPAPPLLVRCCQVLCHVADPTFLGFCASRHADCAAKTVPKRNAHEPVGVVALADAAFTVRLRPAADRCTTFATAHNEACVAQRVAQARHQRKPLLELHAAVGAEYAEPFEPLGVRRSQRRVVDPLPSFVRTHKPSEHGAVDPVCRE